MGEITFVDFIGLRKFKYLKLIFRQNCQYPLIVYTLDVQYRLVCFDGLKMKFFISNFDLYIKCQHILVLTKGKMIITVSS